MTDISQGKRPVHSKPVKRKLSMHHHHARASYERKLAVVRAALRKLNR